MNNIHLSILGSAPFINILNELEFNNIINSSSKLNHNDKKIEVKILFLENLKIKEVIKYLLKNEPVFLFLGSKDFIKKYSRQNVHMRDDTRAKTTDGPFLYISLCVEPEPC